MPVVALEMHSRAVGGQGCWSHMETNASPEQLPTCTLTSVFKEIFVRFEAAFPGLSSSKPDYYSQLILLFNLMRIYHLKKKTFWT